MKTLLVILAILISGSSYAMENNPTTSSGCYGIGKTPSLAQLSAITAKNGLILDKMATDTSVQVVK